MEVTLNELIASSNLLDATKASLDALDAAARETRVKGFLTSLFSGVNYLNTPEVSTIKLNTELTFFSNLEYVKEVFKAFFENSNAFNALKIKIGQNPESFYTHNIVKKGLAISEFFSMYGVLSDETPSEFTQPQVQKALFFSFLSDIKIKSDGDITLPAPALNSQGYLDVDALYEGFIDGWYGVSLFSDYVAHQGLVKEEEYEKADRFLRMYEEKVSSLISNPRAYIHELYLIDVKDQPKGGKKKSVWWKNYTRTTNQW